MHMQVYTLVKIDLHNAIITADAFDAGRYTELEKSTDLRRLVERSIKEFRLANPEVKTWENWLERAAHDGQELQIIRNESLFRASLSVLDQRVPKAIALALKWHAGQKRKGTQEAYIVHVLDVARIIHRLNWMHPNPTVIAAALCHDLLEDTRCTESEIEEQCGTDVLRMVKAVTNDAELEKNDAWKEKKNKYIDTVRNAGHDAILVAMADKVANMQSLFELHREFGDKAWSFFHRGKEEKIWFEETVCKLFSHEIGERQLVQEYRGLIEEMKKL